LFYRYSPPLTVPGVFISQADTSLVLATYGKISSEFHDLESGSWLLSSYMLAMCISQPLFGKLSDIFGRKSCLQVAYILFTIGTIGSGLGRSMAQIIAARTIQGAGGAGMVCMVSILLTDLLPFHEVALYRSYVNVVQTVGRSCGGMLGGFLASTIGWRW
jgi:MFS family permease